MSLLETHPERFGWRYWIVASRELHGFDEPARLISPMLGRRFYGPRFDAHCRYGCNQPPSTDCKCGVHYVPYAHTNSFLRWICDVANNPATRPHRRNAVTFGVALGRTMDDPDERPIGREDLPAKRAESYRILSLFLHEDQQRLADDIRESHSCTALIGISEESCRTGVGTIPNDPSWFTELEHEPTAQTTMDANK